MTKDELLTEGYDYTDLTGYKGDDKEIAACVYMRGAMWMQERLNDTFMYSAKASGGINMLNHVKDYLLIYYPDVFTEEKLLKLVNDLYKKI